MINSINLMPSYKKEGSVFGFYCNCILKVNSPLKQENQNYFKTFICDFEKDLTVQFTYYSLYFQDDSQLSL